jgi:hypothetical protein
VSTGHPRGLSGSVVESPAAECSGMLVVHEDGHRACTRQGVCRGLHLRHPIAARCGGCEACTRGTSIVTRPRVRTPRFSLSEI